MSRLGLTVPIDGISLSEHHPIFDQARSAGYTDLWSSEAADADAFTPLVSAASTHPQFRLGTAIVPAYTRGPALLAMSAAALADLATGEVLIGVGASSDVIVERWNGLSFDKPMQRVQDTVRFLRRALTGEKVDFESPSFTVSGFRLGRVPEQQPKLLVAALRPGMLRLAAHQSDGAIINWLSASDAAKVVPIVRDIQPDAELVARLFAIPSTDIDAVRRTAKRTIAAYLTVPVYAAFHRWLGRADTLTPMWDAWSAGDRAGAVAAIPDELVDELFLYGTPDDIQAGVAEYVKAGVTTPVLQIHPVDGDMLDHIAALGPASVLSFDD